VQVQLCRGGHHSPLCRGVGVFWIELAHPPAGAHAWAWDGRAERGGLRPWGESAGAVRLRSCPGLVAGGDQPPPGSDSAAVRPRRDDDAFRSQLSPIFSATSGSKVCERLGVVGGACYGHGDCSKHSRNWSRLSQRSSKGGAWASSSTNPLVKRRPSCPDRFRKQPAAPMTLDGK
jgi:hypothetical protein